MSELRESRLAAETRMGVVELLVSNMAEVMSFYTEGVGLTPLSDDGTRVVLGLGNTPVVTLVHSPSLRLPSRGDAGLFHTAIVFPDAGSLAKSFYSTIRRYNQLYQGSADHLVSRAFYFSDPEGNGVELYVDRPRSEWQWDNGSVAMATLTLDPMEFLQQNLDPNFAESDAVPAGLSGEVGHVHLQVGDIPSARAFYVGALGFDETLMYGTQALFVSAGGYHHHMAMNTWNSSGAGARGATLGLGKVDVVLPSEGEVELTRARLIEHGIQIDDDGRALLVRDPWQNLVRISQA